MSKGKFIIVNDIQEMNNIIGNLLSVRHMISEYLQGRSKASNVQIMTTNENRVSKFQSLEDFISYGDHKEETDMLLFFKEMVTSAVLNAAVEAYRNQVEINPLRELSIVNCKEAIGLLTITDKFIIEELSLDTTKEAVIKSFMESVNRMTEELINQDVLNNYRYIQLSDLVVSGIVLSVRNEELKILEER